MGEAEFIEKVKSEYAGRWVGVKNGEVVAVSETHEGLYKILREKSLNGVYIFYSPTEEEKRYGFLF